MGHVTGATATQVVVKVINAPGRHIPLSICKATDQIWTEVSSSNSLKIFWIVCQKIWRSRDLSHAPFRGKLFMRPLGFPKTELYVPNLKSLVQAYSCDKNFRSHVT